MKREEGEGCLCEERGRKGGVSYLPTDLPVDLPEVEHSAVVESDDGGGLLVIGTPLHLITQPNEGQRDWYNTSEGVGGTGCSGGCGLNSPINARDIYDNVNHVTTEFIGLHVNWRTREGGRRRGRREGEGE